MSFVYVMATGHGDWKVGRSTDPERRRVTLGFDKVVFVKRAGANAPKIERLAQRLLETQGHHVKGEVFSASLEVVIKAIEDANDMVCGHTPKIVFPRKFLGETPYQRTVGISIRYDSSLLSDLKSFARADGRSLANYVVWVLRRHVEALKRSGRFPKS